MTTKKEFKTVTGHKDGWIVSIYGGNEFNHVGYLGGEFCWGEFVEPETVKTIEEATILKTHKDAMCFAQKYIEKVHFVTLRISKIKTTKFEVRQMFEDITDSKVSYQVTEEE